MSLYMPSYVQLSSTISLSMSNYVIIYVQLRHYLCPTTSLSMSKHIQLCHNYVQQLARRARYFITMRPNIIEGLAS